MSEKFPCWISPRETALLLFFSTLKLVYTTVKIIQSSDESRAGFSDSSYPFVKVPLMSGEMILQYQVVTLKLVVSHKPCGSPQNLLKTQIFSLLHEILNGRSSGAWEGKGGQQHPLPDVAA